MEPILKALKSRGTVDCDKCGKKLRNIQIIKHRCYGTQTSICEECRETLPTSSEHFLNSDSHK